MAKSKRYPLFSTNTVASSHTGGMNPNGQFECVKNRTVLQTANCKQGFLNQKLKNINLIENLGCPFKALLLKGLFYEINFKNFDKFTELGLGKCAACVGFIMLAAYFCSSHLSQVEYKCNCIDKSGLACCLYGIALRVVGTVFVIFLWR